MRYVELATDQLSHRGQVAPLEELSSREFIQRYYRRAMWRSYFVFDEGVRQYLDSKQDGGKSRALDTGYRGNIWIDQIRLDYEVEGDAQGDHLEKVLTEVRTVARHLVTELSVREEWIQPWFSGGKGFHLCLPDLFGFHGTPETPHALHESLLALLGHSMLDLKPVNPAGLIRVDWSRHNKTGLHKIPLSLKELHELSAEEIRTIAYDPPMLRRGFLVADLTRAEPVWARLAVKPKEKTYSFGHSKRGMSIQHNPTKVVTCMQKLASGGPRTGKRHQDLLRLASWMWRGGIPEDWAVSNLLSWLLPSLTSEQEMKDFEYHIRHVYKGGYMYSCQDAVMKEFCDAGCIYAKEKNYTAMLSTADTLGKSYRDFLQKVYQKGLGFDLAQFYPVWAARKRRYRIVPGEVLMITGDTGMLKTCVVQNWIIQLGQRTAWLNLEMADHLMYRRFLQIAHGKNKYELEKIFLKGSEAEILQMGEDLRHIEMMSTAPTVQLVEHVVTTRSPEVLVVDTTDAIDVPEAGSNDLFKLRRIMEEMRKLAQRHQIIVICVHHINKSGSKASQGEGKEPKRQITLNDLTGDRSNVTKVDHVFVIEGMRETPYRTLRSLKTRDGEPVTINLVADFATFRFGEPEITLNPLA